MGGITRDKTGNHGSANVVETYPSASGIANRNNSERFSAPGERIPASEADSRSGNCAQCGAPYEDHSLISECLECGSNNFRGRRLS